MGIIKNGFLIGSRKSAGGINFLRIRGQQIFRNKPQISPNYVPSSAQVLQRSLQAALTKGIRESSILMDLIRYGWDRHPQKRTNANEFQRDALRLFTREADSTLSLIGDKEDRMEAAAAGGYAEYVMDRMALGDMPLTKSTFEFPYDSIVESATNITLNTAGMEATKQTLGAKYSQDYVNDEPFQAVVLSTDGSITVNAFPFTPTDPTDVVSIAIAAPAVQNGVVVDWKYSNSVRPSFSGEVDPTPGLTSITVAGVNVTANPSFTVNDGETIVIKGRNFERASFEVHISQSNTWQGLDAFNSVDFSPVQVSFVGGATSDGATIDKIRTQGTIIWNA